MVFIITIGVFILVYWYLNKDTTPAQPPMTEEQLKTEGLSPLEIRRELRAQRSEQREHKRMQAQSLRTATQVARLARKLSKKL